MNYNNTKLLNNKYYFFNVKSNFFIKLILVFICFFNGKITLLFSQNQANFLAEIDYLINGMTSSVKSAVSNKYIKTKIALVGVYTYGKNFTLEDIDHLRKQIEGMYLEGYDFRLYPIDRAFNVRIKKKENGFKIIRGPENNQEVSKFTQNVGLKQYAEVLLYYNNNEIRLDFYVHDAKTTKLVWHKQWSTRKGANKPVYYITNNFSFHRSEDRTYLSNFMGGRLLGFGEYGLFFDIGFSSREKIKPIQFFNYKVYFFIGPKVLLNLPETFNFSYSQIEILTHIKYGYGIQVLLTTNDPTVEANNIFAPKSNHLSDLGLTFVIQNIFVVSGGYDFFQKALISNIGFKF